MTKISSSSARISVLTGISPEWKQTNFPTLCRLYYKQYLLHKRLCRKHSMTRNPKHKHPLPSLAMWKVYKSKCSKCQIRLLERRKWLLTNPPLPWHSDVERHVPWKYWMEILLWVEICFSPRLIMIFKPCLPILLQLSLMQCTRHSGSRQHWKA